MQNISWYFVLPGLAYEVSAYVFVCIGLMKREWSVGYPCEQEHKSLASRSAALCVSRHWLSGRASPSRVVNIDTFSFVFGIIYQCGVFDRPLISVLTSHGVFVPSGTIPSARHDATFDNEIDELVQVWCCQYEGGLVNLIEWKPSYHVGQSAGTYINLHHEQLVVNCNFGGFSATAKRSSKFRNISNLPHRKFDTGVDIWILSLLFSTKLTRKQKKMARFVFGKTVPGKAFLALKKICKPRECRFGKYFPGVNYLFNNESLYIEFAECYVLSWGETENSIFFQIYPATAPGNIQGEFFLCHLTHNARERARIFRGFRREPPPPYRPVFGWFRHRPVIP